MNAAPTSHTVLLAKPDSAHLIASFAAFEAGLGEVGRAKKRPLRKHGDGGYADQSDRGIRQRLEHQSGDDTGEDRKIIPRVLRAGLAAAAEAR